MNKTKLKPCPFCGGDSLVLIENTVYCIHCLDCKTKGPHGESEKEANELWDQRDEQ